MVPQRDRRGGVGLELLAWILFPLVPVVLAQFCYHVLNFSNSDPRDWDTERWLVLLGPLVGFGFLVGAFSVLSPVEGSRGWRAVLASRSVWVGVGPWLGFLLAFGTIVVDGWIDSTLSRIGGEPWQQARERLTAALGPWDQRIGEVLMWTFLALASYGWLVIATVGLRRAGREGREQFRAALRRGLVTALSFVGTLVGGFWAATSYWRDFFFDKTLAPLLLIAALAATAITGCGQPTLGDLRRRSLFEAMLTAWVLGLALWWLWSSRRRPRR